MTKPPADLFAARRPRLLDLFCGAGGAGMGYHRAGFDVVGVDINPQPNYPFEFHQADALQLLANMVDGYNGWRGLCEFDVIHASPPCQAYSDLKHRTGREYPDLIPPTREALKATGLPYVIENVEGAPLIDPVLLCGSMFFELRVQRHRLFETNWHVKRPFHIPPKLHPLVHTQDKRKNHYGKTDEMRDYVQVTGGGNCSKAAAADAMGISWMTKQEMNEAIPPAYTEFIGGQLLYRMRPHSAAPQGLKTFQDPEWPDDEASAKFLDATAPDLGVSPCFANCGQPACQTLGCVRVYNAEHGLTAA